MTVTPVPRQLFLDRPRWWRFMAQRHWRARIVVWAALDCYGPSMGYHLMGITGYDSGTVYVALAGLDRLGLAERVRYLGHLVWRLR